MCGALAMNQICVLVPIAMCPGEIAIPMGRSKL